MQRDNTAAEKLVEQALKNIEQAQDHNQETLQDNKSLTPYLKGKDIGLAEAKYQVRQAFEQMTGEEFDP